MRASEFARDPGRRVVLLRAGAVFVEEDQRQRLYREGAKANRRVSRYIQNEAAGRGSEA